MKRVVLSGPAGKVLVAAAAILAVGLGLYFTSGLPAPREEDRVGPPGGELSIIRPRDWSSAAMYHLSPETYGVEVDIAPAKTVGKGEKIFAGRFISPPNVEKLLATGMKMETFQGQPALIFDGIGKREFVWRAVFERDGAWYEVALHLDYIEKDVQHSEWWPYIESFRLPRRPASAPSSTRN